ncbi:MAG: type III-B CRISPR module-associated Cmr3 family protein [Planctomycetota bacterium]
MNTILRVALMPRDGFFCKDPRGWHTSMAQRGYALEWPWPSTVLGALRTAWGREEERRSGTGFQASDWPERTAAISLGATIALRRPHGADWSPEQRMWPFPGDAWIAEGSRDVRRRAPRPPMTPTLGSVDDPTLEALWRPAVEDGGKPVGAPAWCEEARFVEWLAHGKMAPLGPGQPICMWRRTQTRVGIRPESYTAEEGCLFSHDVVETLERDGEWGIGVEVCIPNGHLPRVLGLGSDGRLAWLETLADSVFEAPRALVESFRPGSRGIRLVSITPAYFPEGWLPAGFERCDRQFIGHVPGVDAPLVLRSACVGRPMSVSGWDMAAGRPKLTARMVAPGSVYFLERADGGVFGEIEAQRLWLSALGGRTQEGFGRFVAGTWDPEDSET